MNSATAVPSSGSAEIVTRPCNCSGRMAAWCPDKQVSYNISLSEMGQMSQQARYFVAGFLAGNQPGQPRRQTPTPT